MQRMILLKTTHKAHTYTPLLILIQRSNISIVTSNVEFVPALIPLNPPDDTFFPNSLVKIECNLHPSAAYCFNVQLSLALESDPSCSSSIKIVSYS